MTEAARFGWSFVFAGLLPERFPPTRGVAAAPWWRQVEGADWRRPDGPHSTWESRADHPVVHVDRHDALALFDQGTQQVLGLELRVVALLSVTLRGGNCRLRLFGQLVHVHVGVPL